MSSTTKPRTINPASAPNSLSPRPTPPLIPPLRNGDRLTGPEFERRYHAMPNLKKAELIDGEVYIPSPDFYPPEGMNPEMPSPVSFRRHASPHFNLIIWLGQYTAYTPGVEGGDNGSIRLDLDNMPQPDVFLIILPEFGGQAQISEDDYVVGSPELVAEVAYSRVSIDLHRKLQLYRRHGAREYLVWRVEEETVDWFGLRDGAFEPLKISLEGQYRSEVFPGLWLDPSALIRLDMQTVLQVANEGIASPEHAAFVARLQQERQAKEQPQQPPPGANPKPEHEAGEGEQR